MGSGAARVRHPHGRSDQRHYPRARAPQSPGGPWQDRGTAAGAGTDPPRILTPRTPAPIEKVGIDEEKKSALVVVADSQLSLAIGKNGQNVRLAARLTGWKIDIISATEYEKEKAERDKEIKAALAEEAEAQREEEAARAQREAVGSLGEQDTEAQPAQPEPQ